MIGTHPGTLTFVLRIMKTHSNSSLLNSRDGSRTVATSKMEHFVIIVSSFQPLTIITKRSILDVAAVLDRPLNSPANSINSSSSMPSKSSSSSAVRPQSVVLSFFFSRCLLVLILLVFFVFFPILFSLFSITFFRHVLVGAIRGVGFALSIFDLT